MWTPRHGAGGLQVIGHAGGAFQPRHLSSRLRLHHLRAPVRRIHTSPPFVLLLLHRQEPHQGQMLHSATPRSPTPAALWILPIRARQRLRDRSAAARRHNLPCGMLHRWRRHSWWLCRNAGRETAPPAWLPRESGHPLRAGCSTPGWRSDSRAVMSPAPGAVHDLLRARLPLRH